MSKFKIGDIIKVTQDRDNLLNTSNLTVLDVIDNKVKLETCAYLL